MKLENREFVLVEARRAAPKAIRASQATGFPKAAISGLPFGSDRLFCGPGSTGTLAVEHRSRG